MPVRLSVGDPVLVHINKDTDSFGIGLVKYIGFLGGDGLTEYVGLEMMEQCANGHDGTIDGFQYFSAKTKHGLHVGLSHIIRKLSGSEIMLKMQEVVALFKEKLDQYITAVSQRDEYIESLKKSHREAKKLLKSANEKISYLKGELHKQRSASPSLSKSKSNVSVLSNTSSHQSHGSSGNSNSTTNLSNIADIIALESVEHDIDQLMGGMGGADGKSRRRSRRHSRNLSEQIKLDTIDDALPDLSTPAADVPVLMEQLVHSMDGGRRQSFSLGQAVSPRINTNGTNRGNSPSPVSSKGSSSPRSPITTTRGYSHKKTKKVVAVLPRGITHYFDILPFHILQFCNLDDLSVSVFEIYIDSSSLSICAATKMKIRDCIVDRIRIRFSVHLHQCKRHWQIQWISYPLNRFNLQQIIRIRSPINLFNPLPPLPPIPLPPLQRAPYSVPILQRPLPRRALCLVPILRLLN